MCMSVPWPVLSNYDDDDDDDDEDDDDDNDDELSMPRPPLGDDQTFGFNIDTLHCTAESALNSTAMN